MPGTETSLLTLERIVNAAADLGRNWGRKRAELVLDEKSVGQFASTADLELETFIRGELAACFPDTAVIGEEMGGSLSDTQSGWAIDPIDGTSNFVLGLPIWGISIGYVAAGQSILGAIALPELDLVVTAGRGHGLRLNGAPCESADRVTQIKLLAIGENDYESGSQSDARAQAFRDQDYAVVRYRCAVFSLAMAALGRLHGYIEHGCGLWDIAAAEIICREAGLIVSSQQLAEGRYAIDARWPAEHP
jgi:myo-inositol-1(or 4)-monophosphatase